MCEAAPYEVKKKLGWFPKSFGSPRPNTPPSSPPKSPEKPKGPCPAGEDCVCFQNWNCWMCGRCRNGCIPPCQQAVNGIKAAEYCKQQQALRKAKQQTCDPWQVPYWPEATSSPPLPPSSKATNDKPVTYNFIRPCPGEGLGGTWEYCASANLCYSCELCKVCGHCFPSCPEYLDMSASPPAPPSRTPSVSNLTFYMLSKYTECLNNIFQTTQEEKREKARLRQAARRKRETPEEQETRLQKARDFKQAMKNNNPPEVLEAKKEARREYERTWKREQRARETKEEKEARLQKRREVRAQSLHKEPPPPKNDPRRGAQKLEYDRSQKRAQRANETSQEREARLEKMRQYSAERRANKMVTTSAKVKEATRVRVAAHRASRTDAQVEQDRAAAKARMDNLRKNRTEEDKTLAYIARYHGPSKHNEANCKVRKWRLLVASGADAGPEPLFPNGMPEDCHQCDQDLKVPPAGKGRCDCYQCAKLFGKAEEWCKARDIPFKKTKKH